MVLNHTWGRHHSRAKDSNGSCTAMFHTMKANHSRLLWAAFSFAALLCLIGIVVASSFRLCPEKASHLGAGKLSCGSFAPRTAG